MEGSRGSTDLNGDAIEKRLSEDRDSDTDKYQDIKKDRDEEKNRNTGYKANKGDFADSIKVEYLEVLEKDLEDELEGDELRTLGKQEGGEGKGIGGRVIEQKDLNKEKNTGKEKETHHHHHHNGMPKGWTEMRNMKGKQKQKQKQKAGEVVNGNANANSRTYTASHAGVMSPDVSKSNGEGDGEGAEEEVEDIDDLDLDLDLDLAELNSGDDLLPDEEDEEEGRRRRSGIGGDGAADEGLGRGRGSSDGNGEAGLNGGTFKVYRRRWFGLVQLVLLNIIVSWDVSISRNFIFVATHSYIFMLAHSCSCSRIFIDCRTVLSYLEKTG